MLPVRTIQCEEDARRFVEKLTKPPADFDLEVASSKTAVLRFGSAATQHVIGTAETVPRPSTS